jgi:glycerate kinase
MALMPAAASGEPRVVVAPDKLRGTLTAAEAARWMAEGAEEAGWRPLPVPLSDGGEGFLDALSVLGGDLRTTTVTGPLGRPVSAPWRLAAKDAVVESALASGLVLAGGAEGNDPLSATSRGTGELLVAAVAAGASRVLVGVGGSATTDGGLGAVEAVEEAGGLGASEVVVACDVRTGFVDAAEQFGPQKGASPGQVDLLRRRLEDLAATYRRRYGVDVAAMAGSGAAGGLAGGLAVLGARLVPGFDLVAGSVGLADRMEGADLVLGAEGRLDGSSWDGKVVGGLSRLSRQVGLPLAVVVGSVGPGGLEGTAAAGVEVVDLAARFGPERAWADAGGCLVEATIELLRARS